MLLAKMAHDAGALFHTDAVQAVGKIPIDLKATEIDMLSLSGHKLHGPKGIGALYVRKGVKFRPLIRGGPQERRRRGGTENTPAIVGLGKAAELASTIWRRSGRAYALCATAWSRGCFSRSAIASCSATNQSRLPNTSNIAFEYLEGEAIIHHMNRTVSPRRWDRPAPRARRSRPTSWSR